MAERSTQNFPSSFKLFKFIVDAAWYLGWLFIIITLGYLIANIIDDDKHSIFGGQYEAPVWMVYQDNSDATPFINSPTDDLVCLGHKSMLIDYRTKSAWIIKLLYHGCWAGAILWIAFNLRKLFRTIIKGKTFREEFIKRIKRIGLFFIYLSPFFSIVQIIVISDLMPALKNRINDNVLQNNVGTELIIHWQLMLLGIAIYFVAYLYKIGTKLQEENELTV